MEIVFDLKKSVAMSRSEAKSEEDIERDAKMKKWYLRKDLFEKGIEVLAAFTLHTTF